jgi:hypothetical protein
VRIYHAFLIALAITLLGVNDSWAQESPKSETVQPISERFQQSGHEESPSFQAHVLPLMGRLGCNGRACHGSFQGQGGFRLSLFGYDFKADHDALLKPDGEKPSRVNTSAPLDSLILHKPTDESIHEGGKRMEKGSWQYNVLLKWIESGAKDDSEGHAKLERLEITPASIHFQRASEAVALKATAIWSNGEREDVTPLCRFQTNDESIAKVSETGVVESSEVGDTHVVVFYDNGITPVPVLRPISHHTGENYPAISTPTKIDELIVAKLKTLGVTPSPIAGDVEFLRRISLDLTGSLPTPEEVKSFLASTDPNKRSAKVNELLERPAYAAWWATKLCDLTGNNPQQQGGAQFRNLESKHWFQWLEARLKENAPYDKLVEGIVLAASRREGQSFEEYCQEMSAYYREKDGKSFAEHSTLPHYWARRNIQKPEEKALSFAYAFLGVRLQCAECHKHPFDQWSKQDFDQFKAFFTNVAYRTRPEDQAAFKKMTEELVGGDKKGNELQRAIPFREVMVSARGPARNRSKDAKNQKSGASRVVTPKILGGDEVTLDQGDPRGALMDWMRSPENPYFAKAIVNRVWASYFNVGIIEPVDDLSLANPPSNEPLLDYLSREFIANGYDLKWLHRTITASDAYQRTWVPNETNRRDSKNFSHAMPRRLPAEVAYDAIRQATAGTAEITSMQTNMTDRMIGLASSQQARGGQGYVLSTFGKPQRLTNCDCERTFEPSLLQTLYLRNDGELLSQIERKNGWISELVKASTPQKPDSDASNLTPEKLQEQLDQLTKQVQDLGESAKPEEIEPLKKRIERLQKLKERREKGEAEAAKAQESPFATDAGKKQLIEEAYLRSLSRFPTSEEIAKCEAYFKDAADPASAARDLLWALINTKEFITNH